MTEKPTEQEVLDWLVFDGPCALDDGPIPQERIDAFATRYPEHAAAIREFAEIFNEEPEHGPPTEAEARQQAYDDDRLHEWVQNELIPAACSDDPIRNLEIARKRGAARRRRLKRVN